MAQRTTESDRVGDIWMKPGDSPADHMIVAGKFNDWCLLLRAWGTTRVGVYPLYLLAESGHLRIRPSSSR